MLLVNVNPLALNTDDANCDIIKDNDVTSSNMNVGDNLDSIHYLDLTSQTASHMN